MAKTKKLTAVQVLKLMGELSPAQQKKLAILCEVDGTTEIGRRLKSLRARHHDLTSKFFETLNRVAPLAKYHHKGKRRVDERNKYIFEELHIRRGLSAAEIFAQCQDDIKAHNNGRGLGYHSIEDACQGR